MGFYIDMIGVGQGDAFLLTLGSSIGDIFVLIDGGPPGAGATVAKFVSQYANGHLHAVIGSHLDIDHIGGLAEVVARCQVDHFYLNLPKDTNQSLATLLRQKAGTAKTGELWDRVEKNLRA